MLDCEVRLIYAKRFNIRFEIALAPHLISKINQALFYTHLTGRWGERSFGKPSDIDLLRKDLATLDFWDDFR